MMSQHRFTLQPYKGPASKYSCPQCEQPKKFVRYVDTEGSIEFPDFVGRCDREANCAYHYTPKQFFADNPDLKTSHAFVTKTNLFRVTTQRTSEQQPVVTFTNTAVVEQSMNQYEKNHFVRYLCDLFGTPVAHHLIKRYWVGSSKHWNRAGATVFWQRDQQGQFRGGKIMLYNPQTGKRRKEYPYEPTWVHALLKLPKPTQCLFGEHLLPDRPGATVAVVESEKTAVIASAVFPNLIWLASGGVDGINVEKCRVLKNRNVVLFPDASIDGSVFRKWEEKAEKLKAIGLQVQLSDYLEIHTNEQQKQAGLDLADYLTRNRCPDTGRALTEPEGYPILWDNSHG